MPKIDFQIRGGPEIVAWLDALPGEIHSSVRVKLRTIIDALKARVIQKLSGEVLNPGTKGGRWPNSLRRSIKGEVIDHGASQGVEGVVYSAGVPYAAIHEYGGMVTVPVLSPVIADALHFTGLQISSVGSQSKFGTVRYSSRMTDQYAMITQAHPTFIPERSYMRSSLNEMRAQIVAEIQDGVRIRKAFRK